MKNYQIIKKFWELKRSHLDQMPSTKTKQNSENSKDIIF